MTDSRMRVALFVASVLVLIGVIFVLFRREPTRSLRAPEPGAGASAQPVRLAAPSSPDPSPHAQLREPVPPASNGALMVTQDSLATQMHALEDASPERALELARQGQRLWPSGDRAPEFAATEVKCLYRLGNPSEGRGAAEAMVNRYPSSPWALEVEKQTGAHPHVPH